jgi:hypothetical protein
VSGRIKSIEKSSDAIWNQPCENFVDQNVYNRIFEVQVEVTLRLTVSQYVFVSSTLMGLAIRYYFLSECYCLKFAVLYLWGALSDERTGLQFAV